MNPTQIRRFDSCVQNFLDGKCDAPPDPDDEYKKYRDPAENALYTQVDIVVTTDAMARRKRLAGLRKQGVQVLHVTNDFN